MKALLTFKNSATGKCETAVCGLRFSMKTLMLKVSILWRYQPHIAQTKIARDFLSWFSVKFWINSSTQNHKYSPSGFIKQSCRFFKPNPTFWEAISLKKKVLVSEIVISKLCDMRNEGKWTKRFRDRFYELKIHLTIVNSSWQSTHEFWLSLTSWMHLKVLKPSYISVIC